METQLTKEIKRGIRFFKPALTTQLRTIRFAEEVWTPTGIVDVIRFEDYIEKDSSFCASIEYERLPEKDKEVMKRCNSGNMGRCKVENETYPNPRCKGCVWHRHCHEIGMLITCYECKISVSDFKSKNGHNFHGNKNYYVVPKDIAKDILPLLPPGIGLIQYNPASKQFRTVKECEFRAVDEATKTRLLYDALKKWVDKFGTQY